MWSLFWVLGEMEEIIKKGKAHTACKQWQTSVLFSEKEHRETMRNEPGVVTCSCNPAGGKYMDYMHGRLTLSHQQCTGIALGKTSQHSPPPESFNQGRVQI